MTYHQTVGYIENLQVDRLLDIRLDCRTCRISGGKYNVRYVTRLSTVPLYYLITRKSASISNGRYIYIYILSNVLLDCLITQTCVGIYIYILSNVLLDCLITQTCVGIYNGRYIYIYTVQRTTRLSDNSNMCRYIQYQIYIYIYCPTYYQIV